LFFCQCWQRIHPLGWFHPQLHLSRNPLSLGNINFSFSVSVIEITVLAP
jgi:hypothetical protein